MALSIDADRDLGGEYRFVREIPGHPKGSLVHPSVRPEWIERWLRGGFVERVERPIEPSRRRRTRSE